MLTDFNGADHVYIACGYTDLRRGIDGLAVLVQQQFNLDPFTNTLFLFCGRRRDRIKALYWEGNGFVLLYKRLESGSFQWPRKESEARALTPQQYRWLMEGLSVDQPKVRTPVRWCRHSAGHGALIPASWCTLSAEDGAPVPFPVVHGGRRRWCTAAMLGLYL